MSKKLSNQDKSCYDAMFSNIKVNAKIMMNKTPNFKFYNTSSIGFTDVSFCLRLHCDLA